jgi:cytochrome bd ubiquinol oxidase subunit II
MWLNTVWYILFVAIISLYLILDGFDLGVGILHLIVAKKDDERRILLNSIGPIWDGNEVWLVIGGGALFAAFPMVYASLFSGFYIAMMLVLLVLILRAVSIEFRSKSTNPGWRSLWDIVFSLSSVGIALLLGVALGNVMRGVPLDAEGNIAISLFSLLNPFALLIGVITVFMLATHGALFISLKTEADLQKRASSMVLKLFIVFVVLLIIGVVVTLVLQDTIRSSYLAKPWLIIFPALGLVAVITEWIMFKREQVFRAFIASAVVIFSLIMSVAGGLYPNLLISTIDPRFNLTVTNAASEANTLMVMFVIFLIGLPFILLFSIGINYFFRGKVKLESGGY